MAQYLVAIYHPDDYELPVSGIFAGGLRSASGAKSLRVLGYQCIGLGVLELAHSHEENNGKQ